MPAAAAASGGILVGIDDIVKTTACSREVRYGFQWVLIGALGSGMGRIDNDMFNQFCR
jgi:hypothetical protein